MKAPRKYLPENLLRSSPLDLEDTVAVVSADVQHFLLFVEVFGS